MFFVVQCEVEVGLLETGRIPLTPNVGASVGRGCVTRTNRSPRPLAAGGVTFRTRGTETMTLPSQRVRRRVT
jgi:hypothetical protein